MNPTHTLSCLQHWKQQTTNPCKRRNSSHYHNADRRGCFLQEASSRGPRRDRRVKTTYWFQSRLLRRCFVSLRKKRNTESDLFRIALMRFSRVTPKTPCSSTLKSNLALPGLKAHVKLKATLGVGMKNLVDPYISQVECCTQECFIIINSFMGKLWLRCCAALTEYQVGVRLQGLLNVTYFC